MASQVNSTRYLKGNKTNYIQKLFPKVQEGRIISNSNKETIITLIQKIEKQIIRMSTLTIFI